MTDYVRIVNGSPVFVTRTQVKNTVLRNISTPREYPLDLLATFDIYPFERTPRPDFDENTQRVEAGPIVEKPEGNVYTNTWNVIDLTAQEIDDLKDTIANSEVDKLAFKVLFNQENRIRTLENRNTITRQQFINALKQQL